jgi:hypothetical protein
MSNSWTCRIVVPVYRCDFSTDEKVSLATIRKHLSGYGICFVAPESLELEEITLPGETTEHFPDTFFEGIEGYNRLLKSQEFYRRFRASDYILIAQLDCLIFSSDLDRWIEVGHDYLAAPWFWAFSETHESGLWRVGNGGLSLRNTRSHLRVLEQEVVKGSVYPRLGNSYWKESCSRLYAGLYRRTQFFASMFPSAQKSTVEQELQAYPHNEDVFWSIEARKFDPDFRVATAKEGLSFAFEIDPRWCYQQIGGKLPFGCHAWTRYDRAFWEGILNVPPC